MAKKKTTTATKKKTKKYLCRFGDDDLTKLVEAMLKAQKIVTAAARASRRSFQMAAGANRLKSTSSGWTVVVKCRNGHENVFRG